MGELLQLIHNEGMRTRLFTVDDFPNAADCYKNIDMLGVGFDSNFNILIEPRFGDSLINFNFHMVMRPLPIGWRYKRCWVNYAIKNIEITFDGSSIWKLTNEWLKIQNLMIENKNKELTFDYDDTTRTLLSQQTHEVIFSPFNLDQILKNKYGLPLCGLIYQEIRITGRFGSFRDCIEPYSDNQIEIEQDYILNKQLIIKTRVYDSQERLAIRNTSFEIPIIKNSTCMNLTNCNNSQSFNIHDNSLMCSGAYIHIIDENGNEIPRQMIKSIKVYFNDIIRHDLSGFQSRFVMRNDMPHDINQHIASSNLYFISYWPHRTTSRGIEQGMPFSRLENYRIDICYEDWVPINMKFNIVIANRSINILRVRQGLGGLGYVDSSMIMVKFNNSRLITTFFQNTSQLIRVHHDEICTLSQEPFEEGLQVDQCNTCHNNFTTTILEQWFSTRKGNNICPICKTKYSTTSFNRGRIAFIEDN